MSDLIYVDADSHIEEGPDIWDHLEPEWHDRRPKIIAVDYPEAQKTRDRVWLIDGKIRPHLFGKAPVNHSSPATMTWAKMKPVSIESQMISPPAARLASMDSLGIAVQVNYPTVFLEPLTDDLAFEAALMRAWNRSLHEKCSADPNRLKWVALIPFWDPIAALKELEWAKKSGAAGVYTLGSVHETFLNDRMFDPIYARCEELDLPICVHVGWAHRRLNDSCDSMLASLLFTFDHSVLHAMYAFLGGGILDRFRSLKVGFLEGDLPAYLSFIERLEHWRPMSHVRPVISKKSAYDYIAEGRIFFSCEGDETELSKAIEIFGENNIVVTFDFPHVHFEGAALCTGIHDLVSNNQLTSRQRNLLIGENAGRFYGFDLPASIATAPLIEKVA